MTVQLYTIDGIPQERLPKKLFLVFCLFLGFILKSDTVNSSDSTIFDDFESLFLQFLVVLSGQRINFQVSPLSWWTLLPSCPLIPPHPRMPSVRLSSAPSTGGSGLFGSAEKNSRVPCASGEGKLRGGRAKAEGGLQRRQSRNRTFDLL